MKADSPSLPWVTLANDVNRTTRQSNEIIVRRTLSMLFGTMSADEARTMVVEKPGAFASSIHNASVAMWFGGNPFWIAREAISPIMKKTSHNVDRLRRA